MGFRICFHLALFAGLLASPVMAKDVNCENRAAKSARDCKQACDKMKDQPDLKNTMKAAHIGGCDQMCAMVEDQAEKACEKSKKEKRNR